MTRVVTAKVNMKMNTNISTEPPQSIVNENVESVDFIELKFTNNKLDKIVSKDGENNIAIDAIELDSTLKKAGLIIIKVSDLLDLHKIVDKFNEVK